MQHTLKILLISGSLLIVMMFITPAHATQYSYSANVESVELSGNKPIPTTVTWVQSAAAENGDVTLDHFTVVLVEYDTDEEVGSIDAAPGETSIELNKINLPGMKVFTHYLVRVDEYYTDDTSSEGYDADFYTAPPKLKNIRVKNKILEDDGDMTITLKWRLPTNLRGEYMYFDYKISYQNKPSSLVVEDAVFDADTNSATISNLPARKLQIRVRARDNNYGTGQWSAWKKFNAPVSE